MKVNELVVAQIKAQTGVIVSVPQTLTRYTEYGDDQQLNYKAGLLVFKSDY